MIKATPKVIGTLLDGTEIVEILCPACSSDRNERLSSEVSSWECCRCGIQFRYDPPVDLIGDEDV